MRVYHLIAALAVAFLSSCSDVRGIPTIPGSETDTAAFTGVRIDSHRSRIGFTESWQFVANAYVDGKARQDRPAYTWSSSNEAVATVNGFGLVTAVGPGETLITARGVEGSAEVTVEVIALGIYATFTYHQINEYVDSRYASLPSTSIPSPTPGVHLWGTAPGAVRLAAYTWSACPGCTHAPFEIPLLDPASPVQFDVRFRPQFLILRMIASGPEGDTVSQDYQHYFTAPGVSLTSRIGDDPVSQGARAREITAEARTPERLLPRDSISRMFVSIGSGPVREISIQKDTLVQFSWTETLPDSVAKARLHVETVQGHTLQQVFIIR